MPRDDRDAVEMLERCHRQLEKRLAELANLAAAFVHGRADGRTVDELREVHARFSRSASRHVADEEQSIFPRLPEDLPVVAALRREHRDHDTLEAELASMVHRVEAPCPAEVGAALRDVVQRLRDAYAGHIEREERELTPVLGELIDEVGLETALEEMRGRRGDGDRGGGGGGGAKKRGRG